MEYAQMVLQREIHFLESETIALKIKKGEVDKANVQVHSQFSSQIDLFGKRIKELKECLLLTQSS